MLRKSKPIIAILAILLLTTVALSACFSPASKKPESLDKKTENSIKVDYVQRLLSFSITANCTPNDVELEYYGTYNGYVAAWLSVPFSSYYSNSELELIIGGVSFFYDRENVCADLLVYKNRKLYDIQTAYDSNFLSKRDLMSIAYYNNEKAQFPKRESVKPVDEKIKWSGNIDQDFCDKTVLMVMDNAFLDWRFVSSDFKGVKVTKVEALMAYRLMNPNSRWPADRETFNDTILIEIKNPGKRNVVRAIKKLEKLDFVYAAEPNYYFSIDDPI